MPRPNPPPDVHDAGYVIVVAFGLVVVSIAEGVPELVGRDPEVWMPDRIAHGPFGFDQDDVGAVQVEAPLLEPHVRLGSRMQGLIDLGDHGRPVRVARPRPANIEAELQPATAEPPHQIGRWPLERRALATGRKNARLEAPGLPHQPIHPSMIRDRLLARPGRLPRRDPPFIPPVLPNEDRSPIEVDVDDSPGLVPNQVPHSRTSDRCGIGCAEVERRPAPPPRSSDGIRGVALDSVTCKHVPSARDELRAPPKRICRALQRRLRADPVASGRVWWWRPETQ
jgi:hypothetical protein